MNCISYKTSKDGNFRAFFLTWDAVIYTSAHINPAQMTETYQGGDYLYGEFDFIQPIHIWLEGNCRSRVFLAPMSIYDWTPRIVFGSRNGEAKSDAIAFAFTWQDVLRRDAEQVEEIFNRHGYSNAYFGGQRDAWLKSDSRRIRSWAESLECT